MIPHTDEPLPCLNLADLFGSTRPEHHAVARKLCRHCPVSIACLDDARTEQQTVGFDAHGTRGGVLFGGTSAEVDPTRCGDAKGTSKGWGRHKRAGQAACDDCERAQYDYNRSRPSRRAKGRRVA